LSWVDHRLIRRPTSADENVLLLIIKCLRTRFQRNEQNNRRRKPLFPLAPVQKTLAAALLLASLALPVSAQVRPGLNRRLALTPADTDGGGVGNADDEKANAAELAKQLQNLVAALISAPLQTNWDFGGGPNDDGFQYKLNIQPVVPISLNEDWNVISRTILPYVYQEDITGVANSESGLSDTVQSFFFSPTKPTACGSIWGAGPVFLLPTATDDQLGTEKWGAGPTAVLLKQLHGWTYGALVNHL
jgi:hypothetical protein